MSFVVVDEASVKEVDATAEEILSCDDPLQALKTECLDKIIVGEDSNKQLLFLLLLSGKYSKVDKKSSQIIVLMGPPAAGKSNLANLSRAFFTKEVGRFTEHALDYSDLESYDILYLKELGYVDDEKSGISTLKFLSVEDGGYFVEYTIRDEDTGRFTTESKKIPPITIITTTTRVVIDSQLERRAWIINPDESEDLTKRILQFKAERERQRGEVELGLRKKTDYDIAIEVLKAVAEKVKPCRVLIPYPKSILNILNTTRLRSRGDYEKLVTLTKLCALLFQRKLPSIETENGPCVVATPEVFLKVLEVAAEPLINMTLELDARTRRFLEALKTFKIEAAGDEVNKDLRVELARKLGVSERSVRSYLSVLVNRGYMAEFSAATNHEKCYRFVMPLAEIISQASSISGWKADFSNQNRKILENETIATIDYLVGKFSPMERTATVKSLEEIKAYLSAEPFFSNQNGRHETNINLVGKKRFPTK